MSIDGDMRAGVIDVHEARDRRGVIEKESQMFGSMDGAMKFVKGTPSRASSSSSSTSSVASPSG